MEHAHELPEFLHFLEEIDLLRGFVFGLIHTIIPVVAVSYTHLTLPTTPYV